MTQIAQWTRFEAQLTSSKDYENPVQDVHVEAAAKAEDITWAIVYMHEGTNATLRMEMLKRSRRYPMVQPPVYGQNPTRSAKIPQVSSRTTVTIGFSGLV